jgi:uncharacterized membrane protein
VLVALNAEQLVCLRQVLLDIKMSLMLYQHYFGVFILNFPDILKLAAIFIGGTMVGNEFAVAVFFHPRISRLDDATHVRAVQTLALALGTVMPFWYALTLILSLAVTFVSCPEGTSARTLALIASALFAGSVVYSVLGPVPINNKVAKWHPDSLPSNWRKLRERWDRLHAFRVVILMVAFLLLVAAAISG